MNKKGFTLIELLVSITLIATISYFLFQIIFIVRDIYIEKTVKSELYIETANASNLINKDIISKMNNGIDVYGANKISNDAVDLVFTNADVMQISIDRTNNKIKYGTYSVDISKDAKIGNINLYYNFDENDLEKNGVFFIKIPVSLEKYNTDFSIYIYSRYNSSYAIMGGEILNIEERCSYENGYIWNFDYTGAAQDFTVPCNGKYKLEVWGAQGGAGGKGGYAKGEITLEENTNLYLYVGGEGPSNDTVTNVGGWNGGGYSGNYSSYKSYGGGGATDVRLVRASTTDTVWNEITSLRSRILIAGGGGGIFVNASYTKVPGVGGGLTGSDAGGNYNTSTVTGGTQVAAGTNSVIANKAGSFGYAVQVNRDGWGGGGGGGYYGGATGNGKAGAGGSGYVSGHLGAVAVTSSSSTTPRNNSSGVACTAANASSDIVCSHHYSGYVFSDTILVDGNASMPTHDGTTGTMTGNAGNGYARITLISY